MTTTAIRRALVAALFTALAAAGFVLGADPTPAGSATTPRLALPAPTGDHPVGAAKLHLTDRGRPDPWAPDGGPREVGVTLLYPARRAGDAPSTYLTPAESAAFLDFQAEQEPSLAQLPRDLLAHVRTHATTGAARAKGKRPLVLLSPGFSLPAATLTGLGVDLASRGYVVALLDHPYESSGTTLADGRLAPCEACDVEDYASVPRVRVRDTELVLDRLLARGSRWRDAIDGRRIAMAGHSIGGNAAASSGRRVRAAVDLDGTLFEPARHQRRPLLLLGTHQLHRPGGKDESWDRTWKRQRGPGAWLTVRRSGHQSFTDVPVLAGQLGVEDGTVPGPRISRITRTVVARFLDRHLRGSDAPAPRFRELRVHRGGV